MKLERVLLGEYWKHYSKRISPARTTAKDKTPKPKHSETTGCLESGDYEKSVGNGRKLDKMHIMYSHGEAFGFYHQ